MHRREGVGWREWHFWADDFLRYALKPAGYLVLEKPEICLRDIAFGSSLALFPIVFLAFSHAVN
jgi:hypothetical protein